MLAELSAIARAVSNIHHSGTTQMDKENKNGLSLLKSIYLHNFLLAHLPTHPYINQSTNKSINLSIHPSTYLPNYLPTYLSIYPFIYLSIYLSIYITISVIF